MLPEVISGNIGLTEVVSPIRRLRPRANLVTREVEAIDLERRIVTLSPGFRPAPMTLEYDYLVIALGNVTNFYGMPGMLENVMPFRNLADALALRNHIIHALEEADCEEDEDMRRRLLTFVVGGGGFSGVEVMAELNDFIREVKSTYLRLRHEQVRCVLVQSGARILPEMAEPLALFAQRILRKRGIEIFLNDRLAAATSERAILKSGLEIPAKTIVSSDPGKVVLLEGARPPDGGRKVGIARVRGHGVGARRLRHGPHEIRQARAADRPTRDSRGRHRRAEYRGCDPGRRVLRFRFISGFLAWFLWRTVYLMKMPGLNRKARVAMDWTIRLLFAPDLAQLKTTAVPAIRRQHFEPGDVVFREGDLGDNVYVIQSGECEILRGGALLTTLTAGEYFGEMALLSDRPGTRPCGRGRQSTSC